MLKSIRKIMRWKGRSNMIVALEEAKNAGLSSIGVLWGFRDRDVIENAGAKYIVDTVKSLEKLLIDLKNDWFYRLFLIKNLTNREKNEIIQISIDGLE